MRERALLGAGILAGFLAGWMVIAATFVHFQVWAILVIALPLALCVAGSRRIQTLLWASACLAAVIQVDYISAGIRHKYYEAYGFRWKDIFGPLALWATTLGVAAAVGLAVKYFGRWKAAR